MLVNRWVKCLIYTASRDGGDSLGESDGSRYQISLMRHNRRMTTPPISDTDQGLPPETQVTNHFCVIVCFRFPSVGYPTIRSLSSRRYVGTRR
jgi:hypothetical protein